MSSPSSGSSSIAWSSKRTSQAFRPVVKMRGFGIRPSRTIVSKVFGASETYAAAAFRSISRGARLGGSACCRAIGVSRQVWTVDDATSVLSEISVRRDPASIFFCHRFPTPNRRWPSTKVSHETSRASLRWCLFHFDVRCFRRQFESWEAQRALRQRSDVGHLKWDTRFSRAKSFAQFSRVIRSATIPHVLSTAPQIAFRRGARLS